MKRIVIGVLICTLLLSACGQKSVGAWQEQYDLGVRYLEEGNYEEAIIAFTAAIEIDQKQPAAYVGRGDAYVAQGTQVEDSTTAYELYQKAVADYEQAVALGSGDVQSKLDDLRTALQQLQASMEAEPLLKELYALLSADDIEGAKALMRQQEYRAMSAAAADGCFTYSEETLCLAVYGDNCYYFGQWADGQRSGQGLWIQAAFDDDSAWESKQYSGAWSDDFPNGDGEIVLIKDAGKIQLEAGHTTSIHTEIVGSFKNGLYHGTIYETWHMNDGDTLIWTPITAIDGVYQPMADIPDEILHSDYYQEQLAAGSYIVAFDQQNGIADLWNSGSPRAVFGFGEE